MKYSICMCLKQEKKDSSYPRWLTLQIINEIKDKNKLYKLFMNHNLLIYRVKFLRKSIKTKIRKEYEKFRLSAESKIKSDPKQLWPYINEKGNSTSMVFLKNVTVPVIVLIVYAVTVAECYMASTVAPTAVEWVRVVLFFISYGCHLSRFWCLSVN